MAVKRGPVDVGEKKFLNAPDDYDVARWLFNNDEEGRPFLLR